MPPQHVEIAETVAALRRKLRRDKEAAQCQPAQMATNRGNKLYPGARFVHAGSLPWRSGVSGSRAGWTERVNHAGYDRDIVARNPRRYNNYGDELEDSESDADADADAEEENPYADVRLEELLRPLTHPSDLPTHPTLAAAYTDPALPDMVLTTEAKIREERNNLWRAKNLYQYFTCDESWIPCERVESYADWDLFEPNPGATGDIPSKRRKLSGDLVATNRLAATDVHMEDGGDTQNAEDMNQQAMSTDQTVNGAPVELQNRARVTGRQPRNEAPADGSDELMIDAPPQEEPQANGVHHRQEESNETKSGHTRQNGTGLKDEAKHDPDETPAAPASTEDMPRLNENERDDDNDNDNDNEHGGRSTTSTPPPPPRRITRALAAEAETNSQQQNPSPPPTSPTLSSAPPSPLTFSPHPLFLLPSHLSAAHAPHPAHPPLTLNLAHAGLPPDELLETRKLLGIFIQKSEETIRGLENILGKLIKAKRRRDKVLEWCIAEGHVGEMSDGEDWIDETRWGLETGELRKGRDEDSGAVVAVVETTTAPDEEAGNAGGVVMGGRKGKRRRGGGGGGGGRE